MRNQRGQIVVESVLIIALLLSLTIFITQQIQSRGFLQNLVEKPWTYLQGMIENGIWAPTAVGKTLHPNDLLRHGSPRGDDP